MRKGKEKRFFGKEIESSPSLRYAPFLMTKKKTQHCWGKADILGSIIIFPTQNSVDFAPVVQPHVKHHEGESANVTTRSIGAHETRDNSETVKEIQISFLN